MAVTELPAFPEGDWRQAGDSCHNITQMNLRGAHSTTSLFQITVTFLPVSLPLWKWSPPSLMAVEQFVKQCQNSRWKQNRYSESLVFYVPFIKGLYDMPLLWWMSLHHLNTLSLLLHEHPCYLLWVCIWEWKLNTSPLGNLQISLGFISILNFYYNLKATCPLNKRSYSL